MISALISASCSCSRCIFSDRARYASALFAVTSPPPPGVSLIVAVALVARVHALTRASSSAEIDFSRSIPRLSHSLVVVCHYLLHTVLCISPASADLSRFSCATHTRFTSAHLSRVHHVMTRPQLRPLTCPQHPPVRASRAFTFLFHCRISKLNIVLSPLNTAASPRCTVSLLVLGYVLVNDNTALFFLSNPRKQPVHLVLRHVVNG